MLFRSHQSIEQRDMMQKGGLQHIDLWCDGSIYPTCIIGNSTPPFSNPTTLSKFVGDGMNGLYGYISAQCNNANMYKSLYLQEEAIRRQDKIECVALKQLLESEKEEHKKTGDATESEEKKNCIRRETTEEKNPQHCRVEGWLWRM